MTLTELRTQSGPFIWGAAAGAIALAIVGFTWGGWVTQATAEKRAVERADATLISALVPICVAQFRSGPEARARLATLKKTQSWEQGRYVSDGGWATMPGVAGEPNRDVASACAEALVK